MRGRGLSAGATSGVADLTAESDDDDGVAQRKADWEAKATVKREWLGQQQAAADLAKSAMQRVGEGVQKLLEQHLARDEAAKKARAVEEVKAKANRGQSDRSGCGESG
ncbi:hypothetical protein DYB25_012535 [Aphanomyces astaci]|uniref:Uncharacterized protein n=1 Tax=Aphanomyces astaci TaxID=112090 RepID=A0A397AFP9_APHAT|nr:hypothetical protein DYB25_012535 [Aphanomyces astaci]